MSKPDFLNMPHDAYVNYKLRNKEHLCQRTAIKENNCYRLAVYIQRRRDKGWNIESIIIDPSSGYCRYALVSEPQGVAA